MSNKNNNNFTNNIITDALRYYDNNIEKYNDFYNKIDNVDFKESTNDLEHNIIIFYDKNKKKIFESKYEIIGLYNDFANVWTWAWSIPSNTRNKIQIIKNVLNYGIDLNPDQVFLKTELITSRFKISNNIQLDIHSAIASYLAKQPLIYKYIYDDKNLNIVKTIYYLYLLDFDKLN